MIHKLNSPITLLCGVAHIEPKTTKTGKPYHCVTFTNGIERVATNFWENGPAVPALNSVIHLSATWSKNDFGYNADNITWRAANADEIETFSAQMRRPESEVAWNHITDEMNLISCPALKAALTEFMSRYDDSFRRAAAARTNHQAYSGGLAEHTSGMIHLAKAMASAMNATPYYGYQLDIDLIVAAIIFHDCGKIWENNYPANGIPVAQPYNLRAEYYGHIAIGTIHAYGVIPWGDYPNGLDIRDHLCHCILSHHGQLEWGSPVEPKTPEAWLIHQADNTEAKTWMMVNNIHKGACVTPGIHKGTGGPVRLTINPHYKAETHAP
jgi:3'-5' exoribonuclease